MPVDPAAHLTVSVLYPTLLNIYADRGNLIFLQRRCEWRNIGFSINSVGIGDPIDADGTDLIYVGGGQMIAAPHTGAVVSYCSIGGAWIGGRF